MTLIDVDDDDDIDDRDVDDIDDWDEDGIDDVVASVIINDGCILEVRRPRRVLFLASPSFAKLSSLSRGDRREVDDDEDDEDC